MNSLRGLLSWQPLAATVVIYFVTLAFYRLFLHPLARFPGPKLAAVSRWYEAYYDVVQNGQYTFRIMEMHKRYGPIVRISPYELHINDPTFFEKLYRHEGRWDKYAWAVDAHSAPGAMIFTPDHDQHRARRQPLNAFFSKARVASRLDLVHRKVNRLCERIAEFAGTGRAFDIGAAMSAFQRDVSTDYVLGKDHQYLEIGDFAAGLTRMSHGTGNRWHYTKHVPWYGSALLALPRNFLIKTADENTAKFLSYIRTSLQETERLMKAATSSTPDDGEVPRTIVHEIVNSSLPPEEKTLKRVFTDVATVTGAGFETTASVLRLIIYHVFSNAEILERLRIELAKAAAESPAGPDGNLALRRLEQLPFLTAVLMEGLRLSPAIGGRSQRIAPDRELVYNDKWRIPAGTPVGMTVLMMHLDERLYPNPQRFNPERWVDLESRKKAEKTFAPFSRGSRICLGMHLAWAEMYMVVSALVQKFDFDFTDVPAGHFEWESDQFIIGTKGKSELSTLVTFCEA